ncbi:MAG: ABC transporter ATP-binding protein [Gemmataceae bacterium]|nr:ABC transporter ATP-binding protein [Gemmataceae bacterium]
MVVVETKNLIKDYGPIRALAGVSLTVERGAIYGLLGQNGAGKTTLIKVLLGIARGWQGDASLLGQKAGAVAVRRRVGYLPEDHRFPDYHTAWSLLNFYGELLGIPRRERRRRIPEALELVGLVGRMHTKVRTYSKGMKQRVGIAQALFHDPEVLFLDEPTDGVDPLGRKAIRGLLEHLKGQGKTIFINSHLLSEVELICDLVGILQRGEMIREGSVEGLTRRRGLFVVGLAPEQELPEDELAGKGYWVKRNGDLWELELSESQSIDPVVDLIRARGLSLRHLVEKRQSLEELFVQTVEAAEPGVDRAPSARRPPDERYRAEPQPGGEHIRERQV